MRFESVIPTEQELFTRACLIVRFMIGEHLWVQ